MSTLRWEEPPTTRIGEGRNAHAATAAALRARPGQWAIVSENAHTGLAGQIRAGLIAAYRPAGSFEATQSKNGPALRVYARYVGGES